MKIVNKLALISEEETKKYESNYYISYVKNTKINEKNIDSLVHNWNDPTFVDTL